MEPNVTAADARSALDAVDRGRRRVVDQINLPAWYWWGLALGWIAVGVTSDLGRWWVQVVATVAFGAAHASVAPYALSGRHGSRRLSVRADVVGRAIPTLVISSLLVLVVVTIAAALALHADGARHPSIVASVGVAVVILLGGPRALSVVRAR